MKEIKKPKNGGDIFVRDMDEELLKRMINYAEDFQKYNNYSKY